MEAVKVRRRKDRACLGGVCCRQGPERAGSEWVEQLERGTRPQVRPWWEGAGAQLHWRAQGWEWVWLQ